MPLADNWFWISCLIHPLHFSPLSLSELAENIVKAMLRISFTEYLRRYGRSSLTHVADNRFWVSFSAHTIIWLDPAFQHELVHYLFTNGICTNGRLQESKRRNTFIWFDSVTACTFKQNWRGSEVICVIFKFSQFNSWREKKRFQPESVRGT